mgnify:CR=1 FL=1
MKGFSGFGNSPMKKRRKATYTTDYETGETTKTKYHPDHKGGGVAKTKTYAKDSSRPTTKTKYNTADEMYKKVERTPGGKLGSAKVTKVYKDYINTRSGRKTTEKTTRGKQIKSTLGKIGAAAVTGAALSTPVGATVAGAGLLGVGAIGAGSAAIEGARGLAQNVKDVTKGVKRKISTGKYKTEDDYRSKTYGLERKLEKAESKGKVRKAKRLKKRITKREDRTQPL